MKRGSVGLDSKRYSRAAMAVGCILAGVALLLFLFMINPQISILTFYAAFFVCILFVVSGVNSLLKMGRNFSYR